MRAAITSDLHLGGLDDPVQARFADWVDGLDVDELVLLGDVFDAWWGYAGVVQARYLTALAALVRFRRRGGRVVHVAGNHDFHQGRALSEVLGVRTVADRHLVAVGRRRLLCAHGDGWGANARYRLARAVLRSRAFAGAMVLLGPGRAERFLDALSRRSRGEPGDVEALRTAQVAAARAALRRTGADAAVAGHLHAARLHRVPEGAVVQLGDWSAGPSWVEADETGIALWGPSPAGPRRVDAWTWRD